MTYTEGTGQKVPCAENVTPADKWCRTETAGENSLKATFTNGVPVHVSQYLGHSRRLLLRRTASNDRRVCCAASRGGSVRTKSSSASLQRIPFRKRASVERRHSAPSGSVIPASSQASHLRQSATSLRHTRLSYRLEVHVSLDSLSGESLILWTHTSRW